ncbi:small polypeptide DEVIL 14-like [Magnolia sinica]|nr:small polypeptide DEVIL 14-like [Magnolia sinica]
MGAHSYFQRSPKLRSWQRCSRHIREQRARLYIIWRCTVLLLCSHD